MLSPFRRVERVDGRVKPGQDVGAAAKNSLNNSYRYKRLLFAATARRVVAVPN
jgi:hypothetical protein